MITPIERLLDLAAEALDGTLSTLHDHDQHNLQTALDCVTEHGHEAGANAASQDFQAGYVAPHPDPWAEPGLFDRTLEQCQMPDMFDHLPSPPIPTAPWAAAAVVALWPSEIHEADEGRNLASPAFADAYANGYHEQSLHEFDQRLDSLLTPAGTFQPVNPWHDDGANRWMPSADSHIDPGNTGACGTTCLAGPDTSTAGSGSSSGSDGSD